MTKMRNMYQSCMNLGRWLQGCACFVDCSCASPRLSLSADIEKVGNAPLADLLKEMGGWPVIEGDAWDADKFDWLDTLIAYRKKGFSHDLFMDLSVTPDFRNNTRHVIDVSGGC